MRRTHTLKHRHIGTVQVRVSEDWSKVIALHENLWREDVLHETQTSSSSTKHNKMRGGWGSNAHRPARLSGLHVLAIFEGCLFATPPRALGFRLRVESRTGASDEEEVGGRRG